MVTVITELHGLPTQQPGTARHIPQKYCMHCGWHNIQKKVSLASANHDISMLVLMWFRPCLVIPLGLYIVVLCTYCTGVIFRAMVDF
ncbi:hypothetical protein GDO81_014036 [Engystomops pustulosus]|uniref:LITAF domain-containing protein n=1 Tax=Engystomops pustulosus TaxID=76066 RepID=A0AAV7B7F6_ENGPU|nr:hypothetical protein GDO81_014036 [Engystomops pustulosus]